MTARSMVAIVLGASDFTGAEMGRDEAFKASAEAFKRYLQADSGVGLGLGPEDVLDLFDDPRATSDIDAAVVQFLAQRSKRGDLDILVYYTGHGVFIGNSMDFAFALQFTKNPATAFNTYRVVDLASTLKEHARYARRIVILDCCFSAAAFAAFQAAPLSAAIVQMDDAFVRRGTAILCASPRDRPARSRLQAGPTRSGMTLFTDCLMSVLCGGIARVQDPLLSLGEVGAAVQVLMRERYPEEGVRPEVHSPDEREGQVGAVPLFPNTARRVRVEARQDEPARQVGAKPWLPAPARARLVARPEGATPVEHAPVAAPVDRAPVEVAKPWTPAVTNSEDDPSRRARVLAVIASAITRRVAIALAIVAFVGLAVWFVAIPYVEGLHELSSVEARRGYHRAIGRVPWVWWGGVPMWWLFTAMGVRTIVRVTVDCEVNAARLALAFGLALFMFASTLLFGWLFSDYDVSRIALVGSVVPLVTFMVFMWDVLVQRMDD